MSTSMTNNSYALNDLPQTKTWISTTSEPATQRLLSQSQIFYSILGVAQSRLVDFLPITHQASLGFLGVGATAAVLQSYVNPRMRLAFKGPGDSMSRFFRELQILSHPRVRIHSFIVTLEGLAWDVKDEDDTIAPLFVFEKATHGDLETFMRTERGRSLSIPQRLAMCHQIATAMGDLKGLGIIHGDLKPKNVLVFEDHSRQDALVVRITDFGHATDVSSLVPSAKEVIVYLPESRPWSIPPPEYHHRGFSFELAAKAMIYSLGVVCLWLLFCNCYPDPTDDFVTNALESPSISMHTLAKTQLTRCAWLPEDIRIILHRFFDTTLTPSVADRAGSTEAVLDLLKEALSYRSLLEPTHGPLIVDAYQLYHETKEYAKNTASNGLYMLNFSIPIAFLFLHDVDYRVRRGVFKCLTACEEASRSSGFLHHWKQHCLELAMCYELGFGVKRNKAKAQEWYEKSALSGAFEIGLEPVHRSPHCPYLPWTTWSQNCNTDIVTPSYYMSYYIGRKSLSTVLEVHKDELSDWSEALGIKNWIVLQKYNIIAHFEWLRDPAAALRTTQSAFEIANSKTPIIPRELFLTKVNLATSHSLMNQHAKARQIVEGLLADLPDEPPSTASLFTHRGAVTKTRLKELIAFSLEATSHMKEAEKLRRENVATTVEALGEEHPISLEYMARLALHLQMGKHKTEAQKLFGRVKQIATSSFGERHDLVLLAKHNLQQEISPFWWYRKRGEPDEFEFQRALIETYQSSFGNYTMNTINALERGIVLLLQKFRFSEALDLLEHTAKLAAVTFRDNPADLRTCQARYKRIRRDCKWFLQMERLGLMACVKYAFLPLVPESLVRSERFGQRYEHAWGPFYKVKEMFRTREPFMLDLYRDPDYSDD